MVCPRVKVRRVKAEPTKVKNFEGLSVESLQDSQSLIYCVSNVQSKKATPLLLIDSSRHATSLTARSAPMPFLCLRFEGVDDVRRYLATLCDDVWFIRALQQEMRIATGSVPVGAPYPASLIDEAARSVAHGQFQIAVALAARIDVLFDPGCGNERPGFGVVGFASRLVATAFLSDQLSNDANAAAFSAALLHPASLQYAAAEPGTPLIDRFAPLLYLRHVVMQPVGLSRRRFRLLWADKSAPVTTTPEVTAAPDPPQPRRPLAAAARRVVPPLPYPPDTVSPQAQTLIDAAQNGVPFCEECARRAVALADA
jgi:hypothetical protein